jgi:hypothetical protein
MLDSTPDRVLPVLLLQTETFTSGELQVVCVPLISTGMRVFIGVQRGVTDLVKSVTCQVVANRPSLWPVGHGVRPPLTFSLGFPSTASWRVSLRSQPVSGCKVGPADWAHWSAALAHCLLMSGTPPR